jgi:hypothetical protein
VRRLLVALSALPVLAAAGADVDGIRATVEFMASVGSRISGYPGSDLAADYVADAFVAAGVQQVTVEDYPLTVPMDLGGELTLASTGEPFRLAGLWPNHVRTTTVPPGGIGAHLIHGGRGRLAELNGREIAGSIVLLDFNSGNRWLELAALGACAVIFVEPEGTSWREANAKFVSIPLDIPRFWIDADAGARLRALVGDGQLDVRLQSRMDWVSRRGRNVWGVVPGRDPELREQTILVQAYYDGISIVPSLAPSAETASSIAALLELARHLGQHPPARTVVLVATGAHFLAQRGIVDFLDRHARTHEDYAELMEDPLDPDLFISLDLSSGGDRLGIWNNTDRYDLKRFYVPFGRAFTAYAEAAAPSLGREAQRALVNGISPIKGLDWSTYVPGGVTVDGQVAMEAGLVALSFVTVGDGRFVVDTPLDLPHRVDLASLARQSAFLNDILSRAFDDPRLLADLDDFGPVLQDGLRTFRVDVRAFPRRSQVPDRIVDGAIVALGASAARRAATGAKPHKGVRADHFHLADDNGTAVIPGLPLGGVGVSAFVLDPETGAILYAPDNSERAQKLHGEKLVQAIRFAGEHKTLVVFPCASRPLFGLIAPRELMAVKAIRIQDHAGVTPKEYGVAIGAGLQEPVAVIFAAADSRLKYLMSDSMLLTNTRSDALGSGYVVGRDPLERTDYLAVLDMWRTNDARLAAMREHAIESPRLTQLHERGRELIDGAAAAAERREWDVFMANVRAARGVTARAYPDVMATLNDVIRGLVFFLALVLPAAFFGERLVFAAADIRWQLCGFALILAIIWTVISQVHPAFSIAHPAVILLAFAIMAMATFVFAMVLSRFNHYVDEFQARASQSHQADINRVSASYAAFMLGISNMRRRKLRTALTLTTLTLLTFTVLSFTSVRPQLAFLAFPTAHEARYGGTLIRDRGWQELSPPVLSYVQSHFAPHGIVSPRNWLLAESAKLKSYIEIEGPAGTVRASGLLGLAPQETRVTGIDAALVAGSFFAADDESTCLLTEKMATALGIGVDDVDRATVRVFGKDLVVRGIVDARQLAAIRDLDAEPLTPADFQTVDLQTLGGPSRVSMEIEAEEQPHDIKPFVHVSADNVLIMPYATAWVAGGSLRSIGVRFAEDVDGRPLLEDFLTRVAVTLFAAIRDPATGELEVSSYTSVGLTAIEGFGALLVPLVIAALIVLNAMLGAVYERLREIGVYSSVGLAPVHIALLFVAEACVYAVIGVTLGYLLGQGLGKVLLSVGLVQGMDLNYSSTAAIWAATMVMAVVLLSTLYPARVAASSAVPDTVRRWLPPAPDGDRWEFEFPFTVGIAEVQGLSGFLASYFRAFNEGSTGRFNAEKVRLVPGIAAAGEGDLSLQLLTWLAPFDLGVSQYLQLDFTPSPVASIYQVEVFIERVSGETASWRRLNQSFVTGLRKQFLLWHTFTREAKEHHRRTAAAMLAEGRQDGEA